MLEANLRRASLFSFANHRYREYNYIPGQEVEGRHLDMLMTSGPSITLTAVVGLQNIYI